MRIILSCAAILACAACQQPAAETSSVDKDAEAAAIAKVEDAQIQAINAKDAAASGAVYSDDAVFVEESGTSTEGGDAIRAAFAEMTKDPALAIEFQKGKTVVSDSGDMAYSTATYTYTATDQETGQPVTTKGSNLSVWRKQADGSWKLVADNNAGAPVEATAE